jgi:hypothetical protein
MGGILVYNPPKSGELTGMISKLVRMTYSEITFIRYVKNRQIGKLNNLKLWEQ